MELEAEDVDLFTFEDMKKIGRETLGGDVPLELWRSIRLIGMYQGLPMRGKNTTITVGRKIGESFAAKTVEEVIHIFEELRIGIPEIISHTDDEIHIAIKDCFCDGLPVQEGYMVCDLEGAILEGALSHVFKEKVNVREVKCNVNGDSFCEYIVTFF